MKTKIYGFKKRFGKDGAEDYIKSRKLKDYYVLYDDKKNKFYIETSDDLFNNPKTSNDLFDNKKKLTFKEV